jgi:hypothetical protein
MAGGADGPANASKHGELRFHPRLSAYFLLPGGRPRFFVAFRLAATIQAGGLPRRLPCRASARRSSARIASAVRSRSIFNSAIISFKSISIGYRSQESAYYALRARSPQSLGQTTRLPTNTSGASRTSTERQASGCLGIRATPPIPYALKDRYKTLAFQDKTSVE